MVVVWVVLPGGETPITGGPGIGIKGAPSLSLIVLRDGHQTPVSGDAVLSAGDRVRVVLMLPADGVVSVGILDHTGEWSAIVDGRSLAAGRHQLESSFRVPAGEPLDAAILAGAPDAVVAAMRGDAVADGEIARLRVTSGP